MVESETGALPANEAQFQSDAPRFQTWVTSINKKKQILVNWARGQGWFWTPETGRRDGMIVADRNDYDREGFDYCQSVFTHETLHPEFSKHLLEQFTPEEWNQVGFAVAVNWFEDNRIEYGADRAIHRGKEIIGVHLKADMRPGHGLDFAMDKPGTGVMGTIQQQMHGQIPIHERWAAATRNWMAEKEILETIRTPQDFQNFVQRIRDVDSECADIFVRLLPHVERFYKTVPGKLATDAENLEKAQEAAAIFKNFIWPEYKKLVDRSVTNQSMNNFVQNLADGAQFQGQNGQGQVIMVDFDSLPPDVQQEIMEKLKEHADKQKQQEGGRQGGQSGGKDQNEEKKDGGQQPQGGGQGGSSGSGKEGNEKDSSQQPQGGGQGGGKSEGGEEKDDASQSDGGGSSGSGGRQPSSKPGKPSGSQAAESGRQPGGGGSQDDSPSAKAESAGKNPSASAKPGEITPSPEETDAQTGEGKDGSASGKSGKGEQKPEEQTGGKEDGGLGAESAGAEAKPDGSGKGTGASFWENLSEDARKEVSKAFDTLTKEEKDQITQNAVKDIGKVGDQINKELQGHSTEPGATRESNVEENAAAYKPGPTAPPGEKQGEPRKGEGSPGGEGGSKPEGEKENGGKPDGKGKGGKTDPSEHGAQKQDGSQDQKQGGKPSQSNSPSPSSSGKQSQPVKLPSKKDFDALQKYADKAKEGHEPQTAYQEVNRRPAVRAFKTNMRYEVDIDPNEQPRRTSSDTGDLDVVKAMENDMVGRVDPEVMTVEGRREKYNFRVLRVIDVSGSTDRLREPFTEFEVGSAEYFAEIGVDNASYAYTDSSGRGFSRGVLRLLKDWKDTEGPGATVPLHVQKRIGRLLDTSFGGGGTPTSTAMYGAFSRILLPRHQEMASNSNWHNIMLVVTDGQPTDSMSGLTPEATAIAMQERIYEEAQAEGMRLTVLTVGIGSGTEFVRNITYPLPSELRVQMARIMSKYRGKTVEPGSVTTSFKDVVELSLVWPVMISYIMKYPDEFVVHEP